MLQGSLALIANHMVQEMPLSEIYIMTDLYKDNAIPLVKNGQEIMWTPPIIIYM